MKNATIYLIVIGFLTVMLLANLRGCKRIEVQSKHTTDTIFKTDTITIIKEKTVFKTKIKHDSVYIGIDTNKYCETLRIYCDTLIDSNLTIISIDSVIGVLKSKEIAYKHDFKTITNTVTVYDSTIVVKEVPKITPKQRFNHLSIGALIGAILILFAIK
jgi:hypothetical protein